MRKMLWLAAALILLTPGVSTAKDVQALVDKGIEECQKGQYDQAFKTFNQALKVKPNDPAVLTYRGVVFYAKGQNDLALEDFNQAIKTDPKFGRAYYQRGMLSETEGRYHQALDDIEKAGSLGFKVDMDFIEMIKRKAAGEK